LQDGLLNITTIQQLIDRYQQAYDDRANDSINAIKMPERTDIFNSQFIALISDNTDRDSIDKCYEDYVRSLGEGSLSNSIDPILIEYGKILMTYLNIIINETQDCFKTVSENEEDIYNIVKERYDFIYNN